MELNVNIDLEQKQELVMTPRLQTAIELLQYSSQDLEEFVEEELAANPMLERDEEQQENELEQRLENQYKTASYQNGVSSDDEQQDTNFENFISYQPNLLEHLEDQLYLVLSDDELEIGRYIIGNLDEDGFLPVSVTEISENLGAERKRVADVLERIQYLNPVGIAARSLKESLLVQLNSLALNTELSEKIVVNYLELLGERKYQQVIKEMNEDESLVREAIDLIKTLNPRPAAVFKQGQNAGYIIPDLLIKEVKGEFVIVMNDRASPVLRINSYYYNMLKSNKGQKTKKFLKDKFKSALWLIKSIEHRRLTIYRIAAAIIKQQEEFLRKGMKHLHPMTMQEIADEIEMHESTVSRATTDKYMQTPQGVFELKFFFAGGVNNISAVSIKAMISEYIDREDAANPLSDSEIARLLKENGVMELSRRTVAKYRSQLGIPSSVKRRRK